MKKKKYYQFIYSFLFVVLMAALTGCGGSGTTNEDTKGEDTLKNQESNSEQESYEFIYGNYLPDNHILSQGFYEWADLVEEKTEGRVTIDIVSGGALGASTDVYQDVKGGTYDIGYAGASFEYDQFFKLNIGNLPYAFPDVVTASNVLQSFTEKHGMDEFEGVKLMSINVLPPYVLSSREPIESLEDLKGKRIRVYGAGGQELIESWDAVPVSMPTEDIYTSLDRGTIDAIIYNPVGIEEKKYYEVGPYISPINVVVYTGMTVMNENAFNSLPDELKKLFDEELFPAYSEIFDQVYVNSIDETFDFYSNDESVTFVEWSDEEELKLKATGEERWNNWIEEAEERGLDGKMLMDDFKKLLEDEGITIPY